ncbi:MAG TPA: stage V sporulation protein AD [Bacillota bacterium]|nr:stage V sporulation protein AD [Bacillota bacterium]
MKIGESTYQFQSNPKIVSTGVIGGPFEAGSNLASDFDQCKDDLWMEQKSFEKAQQLLLEEAADVAIEKENISASQVDLFISGDLLNQMTPSTFAAKTIGRPYVGMFSACATTTEGLALAAMMTNNLGANYVLTGCASHNAATERQYRYPTEYGGQKPPTAQWTVTGAGTALISLTGKGPSITTATFGKVIDMGMTDPFHMGGAMAPAAVDTIMTHFKDRNIDPFYYDLVITGDLGKIGSQICFDLLQEKGLQLKQEQYDDCGVMLYKESQPVNAGGSGAACPAVVAYGHIWKQLKDKNLEKVLFVATGSLHSPLTVQQGDSIPAIAHAVSIENVGGGQ